MNVLRTLVCVAILCLTCASFAEDRAPTTPLDQLKSLAGTWVTASKGDMGPMEIQFRVIACGSAVHETMFPGSAHEMVNVYHMDGDKLMVTHYCAQGVQPRMKLASTEGGVLKFDFMDCTNLKSREEGHMDSVALKIAGDKLTETWEYYKDGKITEHAVFELQRKS